MLKPNIKYRVTLTGEEREVLQRLIQKGNITAQRDRKANINDSFDIITWFIMIIANRKIRLFIDYS